MSDLRTIRSNPEAYIKYFREHDKLGALLGARIVSLTPEECLCEYTVAPAHFNPNQILHGGTLYAVMDSSQGAFVHFILDPKFRCAATGTATIRYEAPVTEGVVRIRTWLARSEGRKIFVNSEAVDSCGKLLAKLDEIWIALPDTAPPIAAKGR